MGHPFSKFIPIKSGLPEMFFQKCGKQEKSFGGTNQRLG
jgi:hypothetical protein